MAKKKAAETPTKGTTEGAKNVKKQSTTAENDKKIKAAEEKKTLEPSKKAKAQKLEENATEKSKESEKEILKSPKEKALQKEAEPKTEPITKKTKTKKESTSDTEKEIKNDAKIVEQQEESKNEKKVKTKVKAQKTNEQTETTKTIDVDENKSTKKEKKEEIQQIQKTKKPTKTEVSVTKETTTKPPSKDKVKAKSQEIADVTTKKETKKQTEEKKIIEKPVPETKAKSVKVENQQVQDSKKAVKKGAKKEDLEKEVKKEPAKEKTKEKIEVKEKTTTKTTDKTIQAETIETTKSYPAITDKRLNQIRFVMSDEKMDGIAVTYLPNIRYLTNFSGSAGTLFIFEDSIHFVTDDRYEEQIKTELYPLPNLKTHINRNPWQYAVDSGLLKNISTLGFEADRVPYSEVVEIRNIIRPVKFKPEPKIVERFTQPKSPEELANIQKACDLSIQVYEKILEIVKPGITEREIASEIAYISRKLGSEGDAFDIIVVSGPRTAMVHGKPSDRKIKKNDVITLDFGCIVNGFRSDITRTFVIGKATKEQRDIYKLLVNAKNAAIEAVTPAMNGKHLDKIARQMIEKAGYGKYFQHSLGHGIGIEVHEMPIITFRKEDQIVPEDVVLAIEPGVYLPDKFGMRVEDDVFVTRHGAKPLTQAPEELVVI